MRTPDTELRLNQYIHDRTEVVNGCWLWTLSTSSGYAQATIEHKNWRVHRWTYIEAKGPIPDGMELDHLCDIRHCVNPDHLEPKTRLEHAKKSRKRVCKRGHIRTEDTIDHRRECKECKNMKRRVGWTGWATM